MGRVAAALVAALVVLGLGCGGCVALTADALGGGPGDPPPGVSAPGAAGAPGDGPPAVPAAWEALDHDAARRCPGLPWGVLAAIGRVESDSGRSGAPGVWSGANGAGAEGPMQFEPATFAAYAVVGPGGAAPPSPYDAVDAVYTAAALLCADGAADPATLATAVWDYNHSSAYVATVLALAQALGVEPGLPAVPATAVGFAAAQLGTPYRWGGTGEGGFDCSGLVQAAYRAAGVDLPRVAQAQFEAGPTVGGGALPGDLVFFGPSVDAVEHVGLYIGAGDMIDAPHTGAVVRVEPANWPDLVGLTRPW
jgi:cell wall-associated NlpC family hydrolase